MPRSVKRKHAMGRPTTSRTRRRVAVAVAAATVVVAVGVVSSVVSGSRAQAVDDAAAPQATESTGPAATPFAAVDPHLRDAAADVSAAAGGASSDGVASPGVEAVLLVDEPARTDPAFVTAAKELDLTELAPGLFRGTLTVAGLDRLDGIDGVKVSEDRPVTLAELEPAQDPAPDPAAAGDPVEGAGSPYLKLFDSIATVPETEPSLAAARSELGIQGDGQVIAVVDSGIDTQALGLAGRVVRRVDLSTPTATCSDNGFLDPFGHGTQVASIAAGAVSASNPAIVGVAPRAQLVDLRVFDCSGQAVTSQVDQALQWVLDNGAAYGISVVNLSLTTGSPVVDGTDTTSILVNRLVASGVFVSVAAGNAGDDPSTIHSPGTAQFATTVGAASVTRYGSFLAPYSSQGPTVHGTGIDVIAPGSSIRSAKTTAMTGGADTLVSSGTSMAAPFVAGLAALLRQQHPAHAPSGVTCVVGPQCPEGVDTATMLNPLEADIATSDWFDAGPDPMTGRGLVSATGSLRDTDPAPAPSIRRTLDAAAPTMIEIPAHDQPLTVNVVTDTSITDVWSTDTFEFTWMDASGLTSRVQIPCNMQVSTTMAMCDPGLMWKQRVSYFHQPATTEVTWLRLETTRTVGAAISMPGLDAPLQVTDGIHADDVQLDASGAGIITVERTATSALATEMSVAAGVGLVAVPSAVTLPAGPAGTSVSFSVSMAPGYVPRAPATGGRVVLLDGSSPLLAVSVLFPPDPALPGPITVGGQPLDVGELSDVGVMVTSNGTVFATSPHPLLVRAPSTSGYYLGPFVVEPGSNDAQAVPVGQSTVTALFAHGISGDGTVLLLQELASGSGVVPGDTDDRDVNFVHNRVTGENVEVGPPSSQALCGAYCNPRLSEDGRSVAYVAETPSGRAVVWQGGAAFEDTRVVAPLGADDQVEVRGVTGTTVLVQRSNGLLPERSARLYALDGSFTELPAAVSNMGYSLSQDGSAVGFVTGYGYAPACYRVADGVTVPFGAGDDPVYWDVAVGNGCTSLVTALRNVPSGVSELVRMHPDGTRTSLAMGTSTEDRDAISWAFDVTGTHVTTLTGLPLSPGDTNGLVDVYRGAYGADLTQPAVPTVSTVEPSNGSVLGGTTVTLTGTGFTAETVVSFGATPGTGVVVTSPTSLQVTAPAGSRGVVPVSVTTPVGSSAAAPGARFTYLDVVTQAPVRVLDNRSVAPGQVQCVQVAGTSGVPVGASGAVMNVTTVRPTGPGYVVVYPDTAGTGATPAPGGSTVNFEPGEDVANAAFVALPANGKVCYSTRGASNAGVILDVTGFTAPGSGVETQASVRLLDTRAGAWHVGEVTGPVAPGVVHSVQVAGLAGVPADATAVILNVTVAGAQAPGNLRVYPQGQPVPSTSVINYAPGRDKANATVVRLSASGQVSFYSDTFAGVGANPVQVILDVVGYMTEPTAYTGVAPTRVVDTRPGALHVGPLPDALAARTPTAVPLGGVGGVPADATAVVLNVTVVGAPPMGNLRVYPERTSGPNTPPNASSINYIAGRDIPNLVVVALPPSGRVTFYSDRLGGAVHLIVDVVGYLAAPG